MKKISEGKQKKMEAFFGRPFQGVDIDVVFRKTLRKNAEEITLRQQIQLSYGEDARGGQIRPPYKPFTIAKKKEKGQPFDRVTLKDTGSFYRKQFVKFNADHAVIDSRDSKTEELKQKYGEDIFGLNEYYRAGLMQWIKYDLQTFFEEALLRAAKK